MRFQRLLLAGAVGLVSLMAMERPAAALTVTSGLVYHLDSTSGVQVNGSAVTDWLDASGNGRNFAQADANKQPTFIGSSAAFNNLPVIRFDGNETGAGGNPLVAPNADELILNSATTNQTVFIVNRVNRHEGLDGIWGINDGDIGIRRQNAQSWAHPGNAGEFANGGTMRINGQLSAGAAVGQTHILAGTRPAALAMAGTSIGDYFQVTTNAARSFQGDIAEVIVYDRLLSAAEIRSVEKELAAKYDLNIDRVNVALGGKTATQSTTNGGFVANNAIDNSFTNFTHTLGTDSAATWQVDLGATVPIEQIVLSNRGDGCCQYRMRDINVDVLDHNGSVVQSFTGLNANNSLNGPASLTIDLPEAVLGRTVRVSRTAIAGGNDDANVLALGEVQIMSTNLALNGTATQSSNGGFPAGNAIDGDLGNFTHTASADANASLTLDLGQRSVIDSIVLHNRDNCCGGRLRDITVEILAENGVTVLASALLNEDNVLGGGVFDFNVGPQFIAMDLHALFGDSVEGQFIRISRAALPGGGDNNNVLSIGELQVFGAIAIPEPASALLGAMGLGLLALRRKRVA